MSQKLSSAAVLIGALRVKRMTSSNYRIFRLRVLYYTRRLFHSDPEQYPPKYTKVSTEFHLYLYKRYVTRPSDRTSLVSWISLTQKMSRYRSVVLFHCILFLTRGIVLEISSAHLFFFIRKLNLELSYLTLSPWPKLCALKPIVSGIPEIWLFRMLYCLKSSEIILSAYLL